MSFKRGARTAGGFPQNGELTDVPSRHTRDGWTEVATHTSVTLHGKQYRNMREWARPCVVCKSNFSAFESAGRSGDANSQFSNKTCAAHRGLLPALERGFIAWSADLKGIVPGPYCVSSEIPAAPDAELEKLRTANVTMKEELDGLYMQLKELRGQQAPAPVVKAPETEKTLIPQQFNEPVLEPVAVNSTTDTLLQNWLAKNKSKMPWE